jgi:hypothetical protein
MAGNVACDAYLFGNSPPSVASIFSSQNVRAVASQGFVSFVLQNLIPSSSYSVFCAVRGAALSSTYDEMIQKKQTISTKCCRELSADLTQNIFSENQFFSNAVVLSTNSPPTSELFVSLTCLHINGSVVFPPPFFPSIVSYSSSSPSFSLTSLGSGNYTLQAVLSGSDGEKYRVIFPEGNFFLVKAVNVEPTLPRLEGATFSGNGLLVNAKFSSPTDQGSLTSEFRCSKLLPFAGSQDSTCSWSNSMTLQITLGGKVRLRVGSRLTLLGGLVRAQCLLNSIQCASWRTIPDTSVVLKPPLSPVLPTISITSPKVLGVCAPFVLDLTGSTGSGGQPWSAWNITIQRDDSVNDDQALSLANAFYAMTYQLNPPTPLPMSSKLSPGNYSANIILCNFLGACAHAVHEFSVVSTKSPLVSILSPSIRSIYRTEEFLVSSDAYSFSCNGTRYSLGLSYHWTIFRNGLEDSSITSSSVSVRKFKINPNVLVANAIYELRLTVGLLGIYSRTSIQINVLPSPLRIAISGGSTQSVRMDSQLVLDGSGSFDPDDPQAGSVVLDYQWSCYQTSPQFSSCHFLSSSWNDSILTLTPTSASALGSKSTVSLTVSRGDRAAVGSISVIVIPGQAPVLTFSRSTLTINPSDSLIVSGSMSAFHSGVGSWSVDDSSIDLRAIALTNVTRAFFAGESQIRLVLRKFTLPGRTLPYTLSFVSGVCQASITVFVNSPPQPGSLSVDPEDGIEMDTVFSFTALDWTDAELPLSYEFSFQAGGQPGVVRGKLAQPYTNTLLPRGPQAKGSIVTCLVKVYDSLNSFASASAPVKVSSQGFTSSQIQDNVKLQLTEARGDVDSLKQVLSIATSLLNTVDCSINCSALNRNDCTTSNVCASCVPGFIDITGEDNSECISSSLFSVNNETFCEGSSGCGLWRECILGICQRVQKQCTNQCSNHGTCGFVTTDVGESVATCYLDDQNCIRSCKCDAGYAGERCQYTAKDLIAAQETRTELFKGLVSVLSEDEPLLDTILTWKDSLLSLTQNPIELTTDSNVYASEVISTILDKSSNFDPSSLDIMDLLDVLDSTLFSLTSSANETIHPHRQRQRRLTSQLILSSFLSQIDQIVGFQSTSLVDGQVPLTSLNAMVRSTSQIVGADETVLLPQTELESLSGVDSTSISADSSSEKLMVSSVQSKVYPNSQRYSSNVVRVMLSQETSFPSLTITIPHHHEETLIDYTKDPLLINTTCQIGEISSHEHSCPAGPKGNLTIVHRCLNFPNVTIFETKCPTVRMEPSCTLLSDSIYNCSVIRFTSSKTTCQCTRNSRRRRMSEDSNFVYDSSLEVVAASGIVVSEFLTTMSTANDFNSLSDLKKTVVVLLLYGVMWGIGFLALAFFSWSHYKNSKYELKKTTNASALPTKRNVRQYLLSYVNEIFPSVFRSNSGLQRLWGEICRHHRYIVLFTTTDGRSEGTRMLTAIQLLTVQSMLMFIMALCYDLQNPQDDGTCRQLTTQRDCESTRSAFGSSSRCAWTSHEGVFQCEYVTQKGESLSVETVVIISAIVAAFTAPINLVVDFLFIEILSAPSPDAAKLDKEESSVIKTVRRVSTVGAAVGNKVLKSQSHLQRKKTQLFQSVQTLRQIPVTASSAHQMALENAHSVLDVAHNENESYVNQRKSIREKSIDVNAKPKAKNSSKSRVRIAAEDLTVDELFEEFRIDLLQQRALLASRVQPSFDEKWGLDSRGSFESRTQQSWFGLRSSRRVSSETLIREEMKSVRNETLSKYEKLRLATNVQIGLELLHLFILDLLGRTTPVAQIFLRKTEQDFRHSMVITRSWKLVAWMIVILLNLFFIYFSLLRGLQRGVAWQHSYMMACVFQFLIEILFYETSECAIVQFVIPDLARHEVTSANYVIMQAIQQICGSHTRGKDALDAPRYLFVSTNLAQKFPGLLESVIIQSYHSHSPGPFSNVWKGSEATGPWWSPMRGTHRSKKFFLTSLLVAWLQKLGALSPTLQRVIIHMLQPIVASGLVLLWFPLQKYPELWAVVGLLVLYLGYLVYQSYQSNLQSAGVSESPAEITPLESNSKHLKTPRVDALSPEREKEEEVPSFASDSSDNGEMDQWECDEDSDSEDLDQLFQRYFDPSQYNQGPSSSSSGGGEEEESSLEELKLSSQQWSDSGSGSGSFLSSKIPFMSSKSDHNSDGGSLVSPEDDSSQVFSELHDFIDESESEYDSPIVEIRPGVKSSVS